MFSSSQISVPPGVVLLVGPISDASAPTQISPEADEMLRLGFAPEPVSVVGVPSVAFASLKLIAPPQR